MSFIGELKRRNVTRVAVFYLVAAWVILQVAELVFDAVNVPAEWLRFVLAILIVGFPVALVFSWVYEVTPDGIRREKHVDRSESITADTGRRINVAIVVLLIIAIGFLALDRLAPGRVEPVEESELAEVAEPEERSIAVLPFADLSPEGDQEYFSDGIAEEILNVLVRVEGLSVASRTTSFGFKGQESLGIPYMADKMQVRHVLEGSVRKSGDNVRITAQLIDAANDKHLWSETYDRVLSTESIFEIQGDIAQAIVDALGVIIENDDGIQVRTDTHDMSAYEAYLEANQLFVARSDLRRSFTLFEEAVNKDSRFARAWAGLAAVAAVAPSWGIEDRDYAAISDEAAGRAIALDDGLALPYAVLGLIESKNQPADFEKSQALLTESLARDPKEASTYLWRGMNYMRIGHFDLALADLEHCLALDPDYELCRRHAANTLMFKGLFDEAIQRFQQGVENGFTGGEDMLMAMLAERGDRFAVSLAMAFANRANGEQRLTNFQVHAAFDPDYDFATERAAIEAVYESIHGESLRWDMALSPSFWLQNYGAITHGIIPYWWAPFPDSWYESGHPRRLIIAAGLPDYWRKHGFPPQCRPVGDDDFDCDIRRLHKKRRGGFVN